MNITERIGEYVTATDIDDFPRDAIEAAKGAIVDCLACMLAGSRESLSDILCRYVAAEAATPAASVVGPGVSDLRSQRCPRQRGNGARSRLR